MVRILIRFGQVKCELYISRTHQNIGFYASSHVFKELSCLEDFLNANISIVIFWNIWIEPPNMNIVSPCILEKRGSSSFFSDSMGFFYCQNPVWNAGMRNENVKSVPF